MKRAREPLAQLSSERHGCSKSNPACLSNPVEVACLAPLNPACAQKVAEQPVTDSD
jgi:hypothetical protein